jgi:DNA-binding MarR family transcriptional regulator
MQVSCTDKLYIWHTHFVSRPPIPGDNELASAIALEVRAVFRKIKRHLREQGERGDLTPSQVSVVLRLEENGSATVSGLARAEGMRPQSMSAVMLPLQEAGLVSGAPDRNDGRQTLMSLTPKCRKWLKDGRAARQDWLTRKISQKLSVHEQERLRATLGLLTKLVDD